MLSEHKLEVLRTVEASELPVREVLDQLEIPRSTYYRWRHHFRKGNYQVVYPKRHPFRVNYFYEITQGAWQKLPQGAVLSRADADVPRR